MTEKPQHWSFSHKSRSDNFVSHCRTLYISLDVDMAIAALLRPASYTACSSAQLNRLRLGLDRCTWILHRQRLALPIWQLDPLRQSMLVVDGRATMRLWTPVLGLEPAIFEPQRLVGLLGLSARHVDSSPSRLLLPSPSICTLLH